MKANHDARISLRTHLGDDSNVYEVSLEYVIYLWNLYLIFNLISIQINNELIKFDIYFLLNLVNI